MSANKTFVWVSLLLACGCALNAERDNPLDPLSPEYTAIAGRVADRAHRPIPQARVTVLPENVSTLTDLSGYYTIASLTQGIHTVLAEAVLYSPDSQQVEVTPGNPAYAHFELNGQPYFEWVKAVSAHEPIWPLEIYFAHLTANPNDADGSPDIESLHVAIEDLSYRKPLRFDFDLGCFVHVIKAESLPGRSLHAIIGREIRFTVTDKQGSMGETTARVSRIIEPLPTIISPKEGRRVGAKPTLQWDFSAPYEVTYSIRLHSTQPPGLIWSADSIPESTNSIQVPDSLIQGPYYWTLTVYDGFGDWGKSEEASFVVE